jgi:hypothetical protein
MGSPVPGNNKAVRPLIPPKKRQRVVVQPGGAGAYSVDDEIVRTMPITVSQLNKIKKAYRVK